MKDLIGELDAATHRGHQHLPAGPARVITLSRTYAAEVEDVWGRAYRPGAHPTVVPSRLGRPAPGRVLPVRGQRRRRDPCARAADPAGGDVGVR